MKTWTRYMLSDKDKRNLSLCMFVDFACSMGYFDYIWPKIPHNLNNLYGGKINR